MKKRKTIEEKEEETLSKKMKKDEKFIIYFDKNLQKSVGGQDILETFEKDYNVKIVDNLIPFSITFENEKMKKDDKIIIRYNGDWFIEEIDQIHSKFSTYKDHQLYFFVEGLEKCLKNLENKRYQDTIKGNKNVQQIVSNEKIESIILKLQLNLRINFTFTNTPSQTKDFLGIFLRKVQEERKKLTVLDFKTTRKAPKDLTESYKNHLMELVTERVADAIILKYPTLKSLIDEYQNPKKSEIEKKELLSSIDCIFESGRGRIEEVKRKIGKKASERVYLFYK